MMRFLLISNNPVKPLIWRTEGTKTEQSNASRSKVSRTSKAEEVVNPPNTMEHFSEDKRNMERLKRGVDRKRNEDGKVGKERSTFGQLNEVRQYMILANSVLQKECTLNPSKVQYIYITVDINIYITVDY